MAKKDEKFRPLEKVEMEGIQKGIDKVVEGKTEITVVNAKKRPPLPNNIIVMQAFAFLCSTRMKPATNQVLMLFFSKSAYENFIGMDISTIGEQLGMSKRTVISSLKELELHKVILKLDNGRDRRRNDYFINPMGAWRGNSLARKKQLETIEALNPSQLEIFSMDESEEDFQNLLRPKKNKFL